MEIYFSSQWDILCGMEHRGHVLNLGLFLNIANILRIRLESMEDFIYLGVILIRKDRYLVAQRDLHG